MGLGLSAAISAPACADRRLGRRPSDGSSIPERSRKCIQVHPRFLRSHRYVLDYLVEEVLKAQPSDVQTFLVETSISRGCAAASAMPSWMKSGGRQGQTGSPCSSILRRATFSWSGWMITGNGTAIISCSLTCCVPGWHRRRESESPCCTCGPRAVRGPALPVRQSIMPSRQQMWTGPPRWLSSTPAI